MAFRIAQGFVEVASRFNEGTIRRGADRVGRRAGQAFSNTFGREADNGFSRAGRRMGTAFRGAQRVGREAGRAFGLGFQRDSENRFRDSRSRFAREFQGWGTMSGRLFGAAFHRSSQGGINRVRSTMNRILRRSGRESGEQSGREFGEGFTRDANGRLHDAHGRFVASGRRSGQDTGSGFLSGFMGRFRGQASGLMSSVTGVFSKIGLKSPALMVAGIVAGLAVLPAVGAAAAAGLTFQFGAGLVGIGIAAAAQSERVKKAFGDLKEHVTGKLQELAKPFEGTLVTIAGKARGLFDSLAPHLGKAFKLLAPVVELFAVRLLSALKAFGPVIDIAAAAFATLLDPLGKAMGPAIKGLTDALADLFGTVRDSPEIGAFFTGFITRAIGTVTVLVRVVDWLAKAYVWSRRFADTMAASPIAQKARQIGSAFAGAFGGFVSDQAPKVIGKARQIGSELAGAFDRFRSQGAPKLKSAFADVAPGFDGITGKIRNLGAAIADRVSDIAGKVKRLVGAIGASFAEFRTKHAKEFEQAGQKLSEIGRKIGEALGSAIDLVTALVNRIGSVLGFALDLVTAVWRRFGDDILNILKITFGTVLGVLSGALTMIKGVIDVFVGVLTGDWGRAWDGVKSIFSGLWQGVLAILQGALGLIVQTVKTTVSLIIWPFQWLYDKIVGHSIIPDLVMGVLKWFQNLLSWLLAPLVMMRDFVVGVFSQAKAWVLNHVKALRDGAVSRFTSLRDRATALATNARDWITSRIGNMRDWVISRVAALRDGAVSRIVSLRDRATAVASNLRDWVSSRASSLRDRVVSAFNSLKDRTITAFDRAASGVRSVFSKLRSAASSPVRFVIDVVYNQGIRGVWNKIAGKVPGLGQLGRMGIPKGFAKGGITDVRGGATLPGYSRTDDQLAMVRSGEGVLVPEAVRSLGAGFVHMANRLKGRAGQMLGIPGFSIGGIVGSFAGKAKNFFVGGFVKALTGALNPMVNMVTSRFGNRADFPGIPGKMVAHLVGKSVGFLKQFAGLLEGGDGKKVVKVAEKYVGSGGNPNKWTRRMGMDGLPWCGMFVDGVFDEAGASKALRGVSGPAAVWSYRALPSVSQSQKKAGDLGLYRGDAGHINIYTGKGSITIGGNESNSVRRQSGYIGSASSIRRPHFASGGIVDNPDLAAFLWQDDRESDWFHTAARTRSLRQALDMSGGGPFLRDMGGILPSGGVAVNASGQAEVVQTLDQLRAIVEAAKGQHITYVFEAGSIVLDASTIRDIQDLIDMIENLRVTARQFGAKVTTR